MNPLTLEILSAQTQLYAQEKKHKIGFKHIVEEFLETEHALRRLNRYGKFLRSRYHGTLPIAPLTRSHHYYEMEKALAIKSDRRKHPLYHFIEELCDLHIASLKFYVWNTEENRKYLDPFINFPTFDIRDIPFQKIVGTYHLDESDCEGQVCFAGIKWKEFDSTNKESIKQTFRLFRNTDYVLYRTRRESLINYPFFFSNDKAYRDAIQSPAGLATGIALYNTTIGLLVFYAKFFDIPMKVINYTLNAKIETLKGYIGESA